MAMIHDSQHQLISLGLIIFQDNISEYCKAHLSKYVLSNKLNDHDSTSELFDHMDMTEYGCLCYIFYPQLTLDNFWICK